MRNRNFTILLVLVVAMLMLKISSVSGASSASQQVSAASSESSSSTSSSSGSSGASASSSASTGNTGHAKSAGKEQQAAESSVAGGKIKVKTQAKEASKANKDEKNEYVGENSCAGSACSLAGLHTNETKENRTANRETNDTGLGGNWTQNEINETQALANDTETDRPDDSGTEDRLERNQSSIHDFRDVLDINDSTAVKVSLVKKLAGVKQSDADNFDNIVQIAQSSLTEPQKKETLVSELADMNSGFVASFSSQAPSPDEQIASYLKSVEQPNTISVNLDDSKISDVLNGKKDFDQLIKEIW